MNILFLKLIDYCMPEKGRSLNLIRTFFNHKHGSIINFLIGIFLIILFWANVLIYFGASPAEDALILFRYAEHLSQGQGIVWNSGVRAEGATDFLWMIVIALANLVTKNSILSAWILGFIFMALSILWLTVVFRRLSLPPRSLFLTILVFLGSPAFIHVINGFSPPMISLFLSIVLLIFFIFIVKPPANYKLLSLSWALAMLAAGLTRPEANVFNLVVIVIFYLYCRSNKQNKLFWQIILYLTTLYVAPFIIYWFWRYSYFGHFFPLPFYVKAIGGGVSLGQTIWDNLKYLTPHFVLTQIFLLPIIFLRSKDKSALAIRLGYLIVLLFFMIYLPFWQSQNIVFRFQYPIYYLTVILAGVQLGFLLKEQRWLRSALATTLVLLSAVGVVITTRPISAPPGDLTQVGKFLYQYRNNHYTMAVTEAGRLPYFSEWTTLDSYGLNDFNVARGRFDFSYWRSFNPVLVLVHTTSDMTLDPSSVSSSGNRNLIYKYMKESGHYQIVAAIKTVDHFGAVRTNDFNIYFLRQDIPQFETIREFIAHLPGAKYAVIPTTIQNYFLQQ
jgi:hypothetical protein